MDGDAQIVTHSDPVGRERTNYIHRLATDDPPASRFEQIWTYTEDQETFELCCIPFFPYGISYGDRISISDDGTFVVVEKSGRKTIRVVIHDAQYAHERHAEFHDLVARTGALSEAFGHASSYWALSVENDDQAHSVISVLTPLSEARTLDWEWADPVVG